MINSRETKMQLIIAKKKYNMIKSWHGNKDYKDLMMQQDKEQNEQMNESWYCNRGLHSNTTTLKIYVSEFVINRTHI